VIVRLLRYVMCLCAGGMRRRVTRRNSAGPAGMELLDHKPPVAGPSDATPEHENDQLRRVLAAYALLRDPERRARYDRAAMRRRPTAPRAPAVTTNTRNTAAAVRIPGLTVGSGSGGFRTESVFLPERADVAKAARLLHRL
jgi:hypothetical protein